jgi:hypothetical protein
VHFVELRDFMASIDHLESPYRPFLSNKRAFYTTLQSQSDTPSKLSFTEGLATANNTPQVVYRLTAKERALFEQEFNTLLATLKKEGRNRQEFWFYLYYCCQVLKSFNEAYARKSKANHYEKLAQEIRLACESGQYPNDPEKTVLKQIKEDFSSLLSTPFHISKIRDWVSFLNIERLHIVFSRITVQQELLYAQHAGWLQYFERLVGGPLHPETLNAPTPIFNALSVGLFAIRFIISAGIIVKHTFFPSNAERGMTFTERFWKEIDDRYCMLLNDGVWATVNTFTNFAPYFNITPFAASMTLSVFLIFDVALLVHRRQRAESAYTTKRNQFNAEKLTHEKTIRALMAAAPELNRALIRSTLDHISVLDSQLFELDAEWAKTNGSFHCNILAATILMGSFSATLLLAMPAAVPVCFFICTIGIAMYLSDEAYGNYAKNKYKEAHYEKHNLAHKKAVLETQSSWNSFIVSLLKNTLAPQIILTACIINLPIGLTLAALYIAYECGRGYVEKAKAKNNPPTPITREPDDGLSNDDESPFYFSFCPSS